MLEPLSRLDTALGERYRVERELGRGATATVYLAQDLRHDRQVALKVLYPELAASLGPERFRREIAIASKLSHPNILPLYDSGGAGGLLYYVMPYVAGESLRDRLRREIQLPVAEALRIARQVADALGHAHTQGLVHRDVKPGNILLQGDHASVADFGVARAIETASSERLTETGLAVGTAFYMSPEQAAGRGRVDGRSDVYALGCVLYEMLAGEPPFTGSTSQAVVAKHMQAPIPDVRVVRPSAPRRLQRAIERALAKVPADRFATAGEFAEALDRSGTVPRVQVPNGRTIAAGVLGLVALGGVVLGGFKAASGRPATTAWGIEQPRIAVLYFTGLSPDSSLQRTADDITDELIYEMSGVNGYQVISRNGVGVYRGKRVPLSDIVSALKVNTVVDGSVQQWGDSIRVRAQLIDAASDTYLDSLSLTRVRSSAVGFERNLAQELAAAIRRRMGQLIRLRSAPLGTTDSLALGFARKARQAKENARAIAESPQIEDLGTAREALRRADSLLQLAHAADTAWSGAWIERGWIAAEGASLSTGTERLAALEDGLGLAEVAVSREPESPYALELRGTMRTRLVAAVQSAPDEPDRMKMAEQDLRAALDRDSTLVVARFSLGDLLWTKGSMAEAALASRRALRQDAYLSEALTIYKDLFYEDLMMGNYSQAGEWCRRGRLTFPNKWRFVECELTLMRHNARSGATPDSAWALVRVLEEIDPADRASAENRTYHTIYRRIVAASIAARAGDHDLARREIARARMAVRDDEELSIDLNYDEAYLRKVLGERPRAHQLLMQYLEARPLARVYLRRDPLVRDLLLQR